MRCACLSLFSPHIRYIFQRLLQSPSCNNKPVSGCSKSCPAFCHGARKRHPMSNMVRARASSWLEYKVTFQRPSMSLVSLHWPLEVRKMDSLARWKSKKIFNDIMRCACRSLCDSQLKPAFWLLSRNYHFYIDLMASVGSKIFIIFTMGIKSPESMPSCGVLACVGSPRIYSLRPCNCTSIHLLKRPGLHFSKTIREPIDEKRNASCWAQVSLRSDRV